MPKQETFTEEAIVLDRQPWGEFDVKAFLYTKNSGFLEVKVRGAKKLSSKLSAHFEPMNAIELMIIKGKQGDYAASAITRDARRKLKSDWQKIVWAGKLLASVKKYLNQGESDEGIYRIIDDYLNILNKISGAPEYFYEGLGVASELKLLASLGYSADPSFCQFCSAPFSSANAFQATSGEIICARCRELSGNSAMPVSKENLTNLRLIYESEILFLGKNWRPVEQDIVELGKIWKNLLYYHN